MYIEILSVSKKKEQDTLPDREDELRLYLAQYGYNLNAVKKTVMHPTLINSALNAIAEAEEKPDVVVISPTPCAPRTKAPSRSILSRPSPPPSEPSTYPRPRITVRTATRRSRRLRRSTPTRKSSPSWKRNTPCSARRQRSFHWAISARAIAATALSIRICASRSCRRRS